MVKFLEIQPRAPMSGDELAPACHWPAGNCPHRMNSSCPIQSASIIDGPLSMAQPAAPSCSSPAAEAQGGLRGPRPLLTGANAPQVLVPHNTHCRHQGTHCIKPFIDHYSDLVVSAHFRYDKRESGDTGGSQTRFPGALGGPPQ